MPAFVLSINGLTLFQATLQVMQPPLLPRLSRLAALCGGVALLALSGCVESSISEEDTYGRTAYTGGGIHEIDELDLLGSKGGAASEGDIQNALRGSRPGGPRAPAGSTLLVVQSGAAAPDSIMLAAIEKSYRAFPFSSAAGTSHRDGSLGRELRLAAARSGCAYILCYWGKLESVQEDQVTKTISWVPIVGGLVPDEERTTRLRVRAVVIDVASGRSATLAPPPAQNSALSADVWRAGSRDKQVYDLKTRAYAGLVAQLLGQAG